VYRRDNWIERKRFAVFNNARATVAIYADHIERNGMEFYWLVSRI
jgi:hypothetical protein